MIRPVGLSLARSSCRAEPSARRALSRECEPSLKGHTGMLAQCCRTPTHELQMVIDAPFVKASHGHIPARLQRVHVCTGFVTIPEEDRNKRQLGLVTG